MKLTRAEKIMAALTGLMFSILVIFYGIIISDNTSRDDKQRILKKMETDHPERIGQVEILDGSKKIVYYGIIEIVNDGSNGECVKINLDGMIK